MLARPLFTILFALFLPASVHAEAPVIDNPATPSGGRVTLEPELMWRVGGESDADDEFFGVVRNAVVDASGTTYLLDEQLNEVRAFDASGEFLTSFGREGQGPGELSRPRELLLLPDGRIGVLNGRPTKITTYLTDGALGGDATIGSGEEHLGFVFEAQSAGGHLACVRHVMAMGDKTTTSTRSLVSFNPDGSIHRVYKEDTREQPQSGGGRRGMRIMIDGSFVSAWAIGPDGRMYIAPHQDQYLIEVYDVDGALLHTIRRDYERFARSEKEMDREREQQRAAAERMGGDVGQREIDAFTPDVLALLAREDGELWVQSGEGRSMDNEGALAVYDVYDPDGRFVRQVELRAPYDSGDDRFEIQGDRLFVFERAQDAVSSMAAGRGMVIISDRGEEEDEEDLEPLAIACYRLPLTSD